MPEVTFLPEYMQPIDITCSVCNVVIATIVKNIDNETGEIVSRLMAKRNVQLVGVSELRCLECRTIVKSPVQLREKKRPS